MTTTTTRPHAIGAPGYSEIWPSEPQSAARARVLVRAALATWGLEVLADDGVLIVSELVGNVVQHSGSRLVHISVSLLGPGHVRLAVSDTSRRIPDAGRSTRDCVSGRGLLLVDQLAHRWSTDVHRWGKVVCAELAIGQRPGDGLELAWAELRQGADRGGRTWVTGTCWLYCRRSDVRVLRLGSAGCSGLEAPFYGCESCVAEVEHMIQGHCAAKDGRVV